MNKPTHIHPVSKPDKLDLSVLEKQRQWRSFAKRPPEPTPDVLTSGAVYIAVLIGAALTGYFAYELCGWLLKLGVPL